MIAYLDSSALVKLVVEEEYSAATHELIASAEQSVTVILSQVEVAAALARAARIHSAAAAAARAAMRQFQPVWQTLIQIAVDQALVEHAGLLAWEHNLRGYDAVQLAAALRCRTLAGVPVVLVCFDRQLGAAAAGAGLAVWPPRA